MREMMWEVMEKAGTWKKALWLIL
jgi:hypothetical protein